MHAPGKGATAALAVSLVMIVSAVAGVALAGQPTRASHPIDRGLPASPQVAPGPFVPGAPPTSHPASAHASVRIAAGPSCTVTVSSENIAGNAVQSAIDAALPGDTICIGAGTFPEQLNITTSDLTIRGSGSTSTILAPAAPLVFNTHDFDASGGAYAVPAAAIILVQGASHDPTTGVAGVTLEDLQVNGAAGSSTFNSCARGFFGIDVQASSATIQNVSVANIAMPDADFGCQTGTGLGIYAYDGMFNFPSTAHAPDAVVVNYTTVVGYQKNGVTCDDTGVSCALGLVTTTGRGGTTLTAQNGIQIAFGANAGISRAVVTGDHYTGSVGKNADYFAPEYTASGILVYDAGPIVSIESSTLGGNDIGVAVVGTPTVTVDGNTVYQGFSYGMSFDLNTSAAWLGFPVYSTASPWNSSATANSISNVNVGILIYDDNVTIASSQSRNVNVSIEAVFDHAGSDYGTNVRTFNSGANVSGFLLGNISSYQSTAGFYPKAIGAFVVLNASVTAGAVSYPAGSVYGILVDGSSLVAELSGVTGYVNGIITNPTIGQAFFYRNAVTLPDAGVPAIGIWAGNQAPHPSTETTGTIALTLNRIIGPGGATASALAGSAGIIAGGAVVTIQQNQVADFSAVYGTNLANTTGWGSGYDWWQGTQSVGVLVGCAPSSPIADCRVSQNFLPNNAIGIAVVLTDTSFSGTWQAGPINISNNTITDSGGYSVYTSMGGRGAGAPQTSLIADNTFDNSIRGAPGLDLAGQDYEVRSNDFIGTSATGTQGAVQGEGGGGLEISTASVQATDYWDYGYDWTVVSLEANAFDQTHLYCSSSFVAGSHSSLSCGELVTFTESGLPASTTWGVSVAGADFGEAAPTALVVQVQNGSVSYSVNAVAGYSAVPVAGVFSVAGSPMTVPITFSPASSLVTFTETGLSARELARFGWSAALNGTAMHSSTSSISFVVKAGTYPDLVFVAQPRWRASGTAGVIPGGSLTVSGPTTVHVTFSRGKTLYLLLTQHGLSGTSWCVSVDSYRQCVSTGPISFHYLTPGTYAYAVAPVAGKTIAAKIGGTAIALSGSMAFSVVTHIRLAYTPPDHAPHHLPRTLAASHVKTDTLAVVRPRWTDATRGPSGVR